MAGKEKDRQMKPTTDLSVQEILNWSFDDLTKFLAIILMGWSGSKPIAISVDSEGKPQIKVGDSTGAIINPAKEDGNLATIKTTLDNVYSRLGDIKTKTDNLPTDPAREGGNISTIKDGIAPVSSWGNIADSNITTNAAAFSSLSAGKQGLRIICPKSNTGNVLIGSANNQCTTVLTPGDVLPYPVSNANLIYRKSSTGTQSAYVEAF